MDSLLTGEMSLLLLWLATAGLEGELGFTGICHDGILGAEGEGGNCLLGGEKGGGRKGEKGAFIKNTEGLSLERTAFVMAKSGKAGLKLQVSFVISEQEQGQIFSQNLQVFYKHPIIEATHQ